MEPVAIVTGASSGIGQACASRLAAAGFQVYGASRTPPSESAQFEWIAMDVTDDLSVRNGVEQVLTIHSRIDVLVNNAGYALAGAVADTTIDEARRQMEVNFFGSLRLCQAVLPTMQRQRSGVIINVSSLGGVFGLPFQGVYSASKFAIEGLTESLRHEMLAFGVDVVLVEPGDVRTNITRKRVRAANGRLSAYAGLFEAVMRIVEKEESNGVAPVKVADLVVSICKAPSRRMRYTCGHTSQRSAAWAKKLLPGKVFERLIGSFYAVAARPAARGDDRDSCEGPSGVSP
jgi:NAD(P)-dependent dehydrogenase (short-subunit alcohol dehydrogenase family)